MVRPEPYVLCALRALCACAVRSTPFLPLLPPWLPWLVWLLVRPQLRDWHVGLAGPAPTRLARDDVLQRPPGAGLARRPGRVRTVAGLSTQWAAEAAAWGARGSPAALGCRGSGLSRGPVGSCSAEAAAWAGQRPLEPGWREAARVWAWLPGRRGGRRRGPATLGSRASGKPMARTRGRVETAAKGGLVSERGPV